MYAVDANLPPEVPAPPGGPGPPPLPQPVVAAGGQPVAPGVPAAPNPTPAGVWRSLETSIGLGIERGKVVSLSTAVQVFGERAVDTRGGDGFAAAQAYPGESDASFLKRVGDSASDARVMPVVYRRGDGNKERLWEDVCATIDRIEIDDFGVEGVRPADWCIRFLRRQSMQPDDYHAKVRIRYKLTDLDWGVTDHSTAMHCVALGGCMDQVDILNLACFEYLLRRAQLVEYYYHDLEQAAEEKSAGASDKKPKSHGPPQSEVRLFTGTNYTHHDAMICPELLEWIGKQLERQSQIQKQSRKAREERALARK